MRPNLVAGFVTSGPTVAKHSISFQPMVLVENGG
jgi:hypothetical protein